MTRTWIFEPHDTWFFRESRPFDSVGSSELSSVFPPPPTVLAGALRSLIGDHLGVDWPGFHADVDGYSVEGRSLKGLIGVGEELGSLSLRGPWIQRGKEALFPAPAFLIQDDQKAVHRLRIGDAVDCDLGRVRLPELPVGVVGAKPLEGVWLTAEDYAHCLQGGVPGSRQLISRCDLLQDEPRLGIGRDTVTRSVALGMLYQTVHLRLLEDVAVALQVDGVADDLCGLEGICRLGGEGRMASIRRYNGEITIPEKPQPNSQTIGIILTLLTPADLDGGWLPTPHFEWKQDQGGDYWQGDLAGVRLRIRAAVLGKPQREGGWDMVKKAPRAVRSLMPAGSVWYCEVDDPVAAIDTLHGGAIGNFTKWGRGLMAVGLWQAQDSNSKGEQTQ